MAVGVPGFAALIYLSLQGFIPFSRNTRHSVHGKDFPQQASEFTDLNRQQDKLTLWRSASVAATRQRGFFNKTLSSVRMEISLSEEQYGLYLRCILERSLGLSAAWRHCPLCAAVCMSAFDCGARKMTQLDGLIASGMAALLAFRSFGQHCGSYGNLPVYTVFRSFHKLRDLCSCISMFIGMGVVLNVWIATK